MGSSSLSWGFFVAGCIVILGLILLEGRRIARHLSDASEDQRGPLERTVILGWVTRTTTILFTLFFVYLYVWIELMEQPGPTHREMCYWACGIFAPVLTGLIWYRRKLKLRAEAEYDPKLKRPIEMRLTTNTIYTIASYVILFFHLFQYIRIVMGWVEYPE